jgi:hypothetical protein
VSQPYDFPLRKGFGSKESHYFAVDHRPATERDGTEIDDTAGRSQVVHSGRTGDLLRARYCCDRKDCDGNEFIRPSIVQSFNAFFGVIVRPKCAVSKGNSCHVARRPGVPDDGPMFGIPGMPARRVVVGGSSELARRRLPSTRRMHVPSLGKPRSPGRFGIRNTKLVGTLRWKS